VGSGLAALSLTQASPLKRASWHGRLAATTAAGVLLVLGIAVAFPSCLGGPYHAVPEPFRTIWLNNVPEAVSFWRLWQINPRAAVESFGPLLIAAGLAVAGGFWTEGKQRRLMIMLASLLGLGVLLCQEQIRGVYLASAFIPLVAGWALDKLVSSIQSARVALARTAALLCGSILIFGGPWTSGLAFAQALGLVAQPDTIVGGQSDVCLLDRNIKALAVLKPGVVLAPINLGPHTLLYTDHSIIAAGYHRAAEAIIASIEAFSGSEADLRRNANRYRADYVVICPHWFVADAKRPKPFAQALAEGKRVSWLEPIRIEAGPLKVWRVRR